MISLNDLSAELSRADFGDKRLGKRLGLIATQLGEQPAEGFPAACGNDSSLEGLYRFLGNDRVTPEKILAPHFAATSRRMGESGSVLVIHDSSCFMFPGETDRSGLHRYSKVKQGFWGHFALAVSDVGSHPLGVAGLHTFVRDGSKSKQTAKQRSEDPQRESTRWLRLVDEVERRNVDHSETVHVMDREADNNLLFQSLIARRFRFVVRVRTNRTLIPTEKLRRVFAKTVLVSKRKDPGCPHERKFYPARESRNAKLTFWSGEVSLRAPKSKVPLVLNVVIAREAAPPNGEKAVEWILFTSEKIETRSQVERVVDIYRRRWLVEEFFKALKTGCAIEQRQLESRKTLLNALAVFSPLAAQMLLLRSLSRMEQNVPLNSILTNTQIEVLRHFSRVKLPSRLSVQTAFAAIATMGGHLKSNGPPGWITIGRGFDKLMSREAAWIAAIQTCDR